MTYNALMGTLNPTHSLTYACLFIIVSEVVCHHRRFQLFCSLQYKMHVFCEQQVDGCFTSVNASNQGWIKALRGPRPIPNSSGSYIYTGVGKLAIFDGNRRLSLKRCEIGPVTIQNICYSFRETDYSYAYTFL